MRFSCRCQVNDLTISWTGNGLNLLFDKTTYLDRISNTRNDHSWEDSKRKVERLTTNLLWRTSTKEGYRFDWASARINKDQIVLSYSRNGDQKLFYVDWDEKTGTNAEKNISLFLAQLLV